MRGLGNHEFPDCEKNDLDLDFFGSVKNVGVVVTLIYFRALFFLKNDWF